MNDFAQQLIDVLVRIHEELHRFVEPEVELMALQLDQERREKDTRDMRRAGQAACGNCDKFLEADWAWMKSHARTRPSVRAWTGWCTHQTRNPKRVRGDPTERQSDSPPCRFYEALHGPALPPIDPLEEIHHERH